MVTAERVEPLAKSRPLPQCNNYAFGRSPHGVHLETGCDSHFANNFPFIIHKFINLSLYMALC